MASKNVLIVSESLAQGGLETRLWTQAKALRTLGHRVYFATASAQVPPALAQVSDGVFPGLALGHNASAYQCASAASALAKLIEEKQVDLVHAHPYASLLPAALAAALAHKPLVVTSHGPTSFVGGPNADSALFDTVLPYAGAIELVSEELKTLMPTVLEARLKVVPNGVDLDHFRAAKRSAGGPWAFIGRLEDGKARALESLVQWSPALGIKEWHVVGSGRDQAETQAALTAKAGAVTVKFLEWNDDIAALLAQGYAGVAGMGRVVLEAGAMGLPCILAGYGAVHGLVTAQRFEGFAWSNFSGRGAVGVSEEQLVAELKAMTDKQLADTRRCVEAGHDEAKLSVRHEAMLLEAKVVPLARLRLLQMHGLLRRSDPATNLAWGADHSLSVGLSTLLRQPGELFLPNIAHQLKVSVDASVRAALTGQQDALRAELSELKRMVMSSQTVAAPQLGEIQRSLAAMGERVEALQKSVTALSEQLGAVKEAMPRPLVEQTRDVVARLRGRTR